MPGENVFDQFDQQQSNPFDQFDVSPPPQAGGGQTLPVRPGIYGEAALQTGKDVGRQLLRIPRILSDAAAAIPLAAADAGVTARNMLTGSNYQLPSSMYSEAWQATGLPQAETTIEKVGDFVASGVAGARLPLPSVAKPAPVATGVPRAPNAAAAVISEGEKHNVPVFFDDVTRNAMAKRLGVAAESIPFVGTSGGRAAQHTAAQTAARRVVSEFGDDVGDDVPVLIQQGLQTKLKQFKGTARRLYDDAAAQLDPEGNVPVRRLATEIDNEIANQQSLGTLADQKIIELLQKYRTAPAGNFTLMRKMRSQIGQAVSDFYTGKNTAIGGEGAAILQRMKGALDEDLSTFARNTGGKGFEAWRRADGFYRTNLVPFKEAGFRDLVKTAEPEKAWRYLVAQGSVPSRAARMYRGLTEEGRSAVRYGLVKEAMDTGTTPQGTFSPAKFAKYLEDHESAVNTFFKGRELAEIKGFQNLMRHVERAGQFAENPPTGQRVIPWLLLGGAAIKPIPAAVAATSTYGIKTLFQTARGRNLLLAMGRVAEGSPAAARITQEIAKIGATTGAVAATQSGIAEENE